MGGFLLPNAQIDSAEVQVMGTCCRQPCVSTFAMAANGLR